MTTISIDKIFKNTIIQSLFGNIYQLYFLLSLLFRIWSIIIQNIIEKETFRNCEYEISPKQKICCIRAVRYTRNPMLFGTLSDLFGFGNIFKFSNCNIDSVFIYCIYVDLRCKN